MKHLSDIKLVNFRNWSNRSFSFSPNITLITGNNGKGKTNILESIQLLAQGSTFRRSHNSHLIRLEQQHAYIEGKVTKEQQQNTTLSILIDRSHKKYTVNGKTKSASNYQQHCYSVVFLPQHLNLVNGTPELRRSFLDENLGITIPEYQRIRSDYANLLKQRNSILSQEFPDRWNREYWDQQLIDLATNIIYLRKNLVDRLNSILAHQGIRVDYLPSPRAILRELDRDNQWSQDNIEAIFREKLLEINRKERELGFTLIGPQRDDLVFLGPIKQREDIDISIYASRGEQRLYIVQLKIAQLEYLAQELRQRPILLLDDVFSEIDSKARQLLLSNLTRQQKFITSVMPITDLDTTTQIHLE